MSPGLIKMWFSLAGLGFMFISVFFVYLAQFKLKNRILQFILNFVSLVLILLSGLIIFFIVFSGPVSE
ncbi:DUF2768 domain-containing protein [Bacillus sp. HMF5848]|nr:DUF2768 domain-containing protein [Bacillus sp. HMF5848]RSK27442.1 DUF2768 domain-containing protein [Bacillus sp. HMF5848]